MSQTSVHKLKNNQSPARIQNVEHVDIPGSQANITVIAPGIVITDDSSGAWVKVGQSSVVRIQVAGDTYVAFGDDSTAGAVTVTTSPGLKLEAGYHYVRATGPLMRTSVNPVRIEVLEC